VFLPRALIAAALLGLAAPCPAADFGDLLPPVQIQAGGKPLDVERDGHAAPFVGDIDGSGVPALLVGQFHEGRLRIYRNRGSRTRPRFDAFSWFEAGGKVVSVPVWG
jgi:hypothetical protein